MELMKMWTFFPPKALALHLIFLKAFALHLIFLKHIEDR